MGGTGTGGTGAEEIKRINHLRPLSVLPFGSPFGSFGWKDSGETAQVAHICGSIQISPVVIGTEGPGLRPEALAIYSVQRLAACQQRRK